ncbi:MAG: MarR family transcriptional regulator [Dehalococcoidia bacterium]|nr:MAG: MarR family transcriptional regulator [Dehalococcoidia bacterium]
MIMKNARTESRNNKMTEKDEVVDRILQGVSNIFREVLPLAHKELLEMDLTAPQLKVVLLLYLYGPTRMSELAGSLGVTLATATGIADRLVERGLLTRENDKDDRRVVMCSLSGHGQEITDNLWVTSREKARELLSAMDISRLKLIDEALGTMIAVGTGDKKVI